MMAFLAVAADRERGARDLGWARRWPTWPCSCRSAARFGAAVDGREHRASAVTARELPGELVTYCWRLTLLWCVFFALNAAFITWLAFYASLASWTI